MKEKDWEDLLKFSSIVALAMIPFIVWDKIEDYAASQQWILLVTFPVVAILSTFCAVTFIAIIRDDQLSLFRIGLLCALFVNAIVGIIGNFAIISFFQNTWHWSAWVMGIVCWIIVSIFTAVFSFKKLFSA